MRHACDTIYECPRIFRCITALNTGPCGSVVCFFVWHRPGSKNHETRSEAMAKHVHSRVVTVRSHNLVWHASCLTQSNARRQCQQQHLRHHTPSLQQPLLAPVGEHSEPTASSSLNCCQRWWQDFISRPRPASGDVRRQPTCRMAQTPVSECTPFSFDTGLVAQSTRRVIDCEQNPGRACINHHATNLRPGNRGACARHCRRC